MKRVFLLAAIPLLAIGAAPAPEAITMTDSSWGQMVAQWRIEPDGSIYYAAIGEPWSPGAHSPLIAHRTAASPARYRWIARLLRPARAWAGKQMPCAHPMTDQDSGTVSWGKATRLGYYAGCTEPETRNVITLLFKAQNQIATWAAHAPVVPTTEDRPPS